MPKQKIPSYWAASPRKGLAMTDSVAPKPATSNPVDLCDSFAPSPVIASPFGGEATQHGGSNHIHSHTPVLLNEVLAHLQPKDGEVYVDCTFGDGGYSEAILNAANATVYALDIDPAVSARADNIKAKLQTNSKLEFIQGNFANLDSILENLGVSSVDAIIADLGVSSMQIDQADRGFSFQKAGPLDMRMAQTGVSAYELVNNHSKEELADIIFNYGEEGKARQIARAIVMHRETIPITSTTQLAEIVHKVCGKPNRGRPSKIDPATKTFQAIRIWVNDELANLRKLLQAAESLLNEGGRLIIISFHSLEDGIVKKFLQEVGAKKPAPSRYVPEEIKADEALAFKIVTKKPITPSEAELARNVRARSAKMRVGIRINKGKTYD